MNDDAEREDNLRIEFVPGQPLIAMVDSKMFEGVNAPNVEGHSYDWRIFPGQHGNTRGIVARYVVGTLADLLQREYDTGAHVVNYVLYDAAGQPLTDQPRVNKSGLKWVESQGYRVLLGTIMIDIDNPKLKPGVKRPWDAELLDEWLTHERTQPLLQGAGRYFTRHGLRLIYPLDRLLTPAEHERATRALINELLRAGLEPDETCVDWTRHFKTPIFGNDLRAGVPHEGVLYRGALVLPDRVFTPNLDAEEAEPVFRDDLRSKRRARERAERRAEGVPRQFDVELPKAYRVLVEILGKSVATAAQRGQAYHPMGLALAGALCDRRAVPLAFVPAVVTHALMAGGGTDLGDALEPAKNTVRRFVEDGIHVTGTAHLRKHYPDLADGLDLALAGQREAALREQMNARAEDPPPPPADAVADAQYLFLLLPRSGVNLLGSAPGLGKSRAARLVAVERALEPMREDAKRAPLNSKTAILCDKNELAIEHKQKIEAEYKLPVKRLFSPASLRDAAGHPVCIYADAARALIEAGASMQYELCNGRDQTPCPKRETCTAYSGQDGDDDARILVAPHQLVGRAIEEIGTTGLLILDEPPFILDTVELTLATLRGALAFDGLGRRYRTALRPAIEALLQHAAADEPPVEHVLLDAALRSGARGVSPAALEEALRRTGLTASGDVGADIIAAAQLAHDEEAPTQGPVFTLVEIHAARQSAGYAQRLRDVARVFNTLYRGLTATHETAVWIEERGDQRCVILKRMKPEYVDALRVPGSVALLDANMDLHRDIVAKIVGYEPPIKTFEAADGAPITRTMFRASGSSRRGWMLDGLPLWDRLKRPLEWTVNWLRGDPQRARVGLITYQVLEVAFAAVLGGVNEASSEAWERLGFSLDELLKAHDTLGETLRAWSGAWLLGHYGGVRGLDKFNQADLDALVTFGDPWPNLGDVERNCAFLGGLDPEARAEAMCRAELQQAMGRARECRRVRAMALLHVGNVLPGGHAWERGNVLYEYDLGGPRATPTGMLSAAQLREIRARLQMTLADFAKALRVSLATLKRYLSGEHPIPNPVAVSAMFMGMESSPEFADAVANAPQI